MMVAAADINLGDSIKLPELLSKTKRMYNFEYRSRRGPEENLWQKYMSGIGGSDDIQLLNFE